MDGGDRRQYRSVQLQSMKAFGCVCAAGFALLLLAEMAHRPDAVVVGYMVVVALFGVVMLVAAVRALRGGLVLDERGVTARSTFSTRSFRWEELRAAGTYDRTSHRSALVGLSPMRVRESRTQVLPAVQLTSGKVVRLQGLRVSIPDPNTPNWVDEGIQEVRRRLAARRQHGADT